MRRKVFFYLIFLLLTIVCRAQTDTDKLVKLHQANMRELYAGRGILDWGYGDVSLQNVQQMLGSYYAKEAVGVLLYIHRNDTLFISLFDDTKIVETKAVPITSDSIASLQYQLVCALGIMTAAETYSPAKRGITPDSHPVYKETYRKNIIRQTSALFLPFPSALGKYKHLIIVPALGIGAIPFAALQPFNDHSCLIEHLSYSVSPSLYEMMVSSLMISPFSAYGEKNDPTLRFGSAMIVGNPLFPAGQEYVFPNLPGAEAEAKAVFETLRVGKKILLLGTEATKDTIISVMNSCGLLYFATHGVSDPENPLDSSYLVLSGSDGYDYRLTAREIQKMRLQASMAVLSACQSGLGRSDAGGMVGLSRAFHIAGVRYTVMSLWNIDDAATAEIMCDFIKNLATVGKYMPHEALRKAQLKYKAAHPDQEGKWAGFAIFGLPY